jgi:hypothetical protein
VGDDTLHETIRNLRSELAFIENAIRNLEDLVGLREARTRRELIVTTPTDMRLAAADRRLA